MSDQLLDLARFGDCAVRRDMDAVTGAVVYVIESADPRIVIADELLAELKVGHYAPIMSMRDDVLTIRGANRTVVYRVDREQHDPYHGVTVAEWPD